MSDVIITDINLLKIPSNDVTLEDIKEHDLFNRLQKALKGAWTTGFGLAAIQIGEPYRYAIYKWNNEWKELVNPKILEKRFIIQCLKEGCLSILNTWINTKRFESIIYVNNDHQCHHCDGLEAQIIQHEIDHMNGILTIDREWKNIQLGRNEKCYCNSGKKYKKCCLLKEDV